MCSERVGGREGGARFCFHIHNPLIYIHIGYGLTIHSRLRFGANFLARVLLYNSKFVVKCPSLFVLGAATNDIFFLRLS